MDDLQAYIRERIRILEDDVEFWRGKYARRYIDEDAQYCLDQIRLKQAIIDELRILLKFDGR